MRAELETVTVEKEGQTANVTLDRPERLNANSHEMARDLDAVSQLLADEKAVRVVVIEGAGRAFSAGIDLKELPKGEVDIRMMPPWERGLRRFETMDALVFSLVHGYAIGGGLQIALASDIRVCTPDAQLGLTAIEESILPGLGTWRLPRYIGLGRAMKMNTLGNYIDGEEARRIGLVDHLVEAETRHDELDGIIEKYMKGNSLGARNTKHATNAAFDHDYEEFMDLYLELQREAMSSADFEEAMAALREDREPEWG